VAGVSSCAGGVVDNLAVISERSDAPMIVSCEKKTIPRIRVTIAWKSNIIFAHLMRT